MEDGNEPESARPLFPSSILNPPSSPASDWPSLIAHIHAASRPAVIAVTGGGASAIAGLLAVPGGSRTVLEAIVPYSAAALTEWLGRRPEQFCAEETALAMATVAYRRAMHLGPALEQQIGVACTASLVSQTPKRGDHRCFVATHTAAATSSYSLVLEKGVRDRRAEEMLTGHLLLTALAGANGVEDIPPLELRPGESVVRETAVADRLLSDLALARRRVVWSVPGQGLVASPRETPRGLLCGAFAPLHAGHRTLRDVAAHRLGGLVGYELSIQNVDKPPLDYLTIARRRRQFDEHPLALTIAPTFVEKARVLPGTTFVVGVDTAERIVQERYYGNSIEALRTALTEIRQQGCRFLVAGRLIGDRFVTLEEISIPSEFADLFEPVPASEFRVDVSSTAIRAAGAPNPE